MKELTPEEPKATMRELTPEEMDGVSGGTLFGLFMAEAIWDGLKYMADHPPKFQPGSKTPTW